jgi:DNA polymerase-3 subunit epsilon
MTTKLSDVGRDLYDQLTARTFYVVDTEFCTVGGEHHLISLAVVPVIGGRRANASGQAYWEMNPGVPIDADTSAVHGLTDQDVAALPGFHHFAAVILQRLREDGAVFVCHNTIDAHVLRAELARLDDRAAAGETGITTGTPDLPVLPVVDTQRLAYETGYPGIGRGVKLSLDALCDATGVPRTADAHNALEDARATAAALIELLRYAAEKCVFFTFDALLAAAGAGTTSAPAGPAHITPRSSMAIDIPAEHLSRHIEPLSDPVTAGSEQAERWLEMAAECATLRCPFLRDEATVAAWHNGAVLLRPLMEDVPHLAEPGQAGTLLGAVLQLLTAPAADPATPTLPVKRAIRWWQGARPAIHASTRCDTSSPATCCPSCLDGEPCPRDVMHLPVAEIVTLGGRGIMDTQRVRDLTAKTTKSPLNTWRKHEPELLAYALWRCARYLLDEGLDEHAFTVLDQGIALNLHTIEPRLAELAGERLVELGDGDKALRVARTVVAQRTSDTAYDDLASWIQFTENALYAQQAQPRPPITHPRKARPDGLVHPRLYS